VAVEPCSIRLSDAGTKVTSSPGVLVLPETGRPGLHRPGAAPGDGQLATHKRIEVRDWLAANPRITTHFTPTSGSWLNLGEVWFGIIERQAIRRGTFNSVRDLNAKIRAFVNG
jgi:hypothetical protein